MHAATPDGSVVRFGVFEVDPRAGELRRRGVKLRLQEQPFALLMALLERPGQVVTREELRQRLWTSETFVDFDHSLATAINKVRHVLGDSASSPRFVETLARRGYRFLAPVQPARTNGVAAIDSVAVLPFENASGEAAAEYLSDGLTDSIIINLSQLPNLRVMARTTVFRYKHRTEDALATGRELGVRAVLVGRVSQRAGRVVIGTELVEVANGSLLWGAQFDRERSDLSLVEGALATEICRALHVTLTPALRTRLERRSTGDPEAHWSYLKGRHEANKLSAAGLQAGIVHFRDAIRLDPRHALAHAALAAAYNLLGFFGLLPPAEVFHRARVAAVAALALDDGLAEAHAVMASVLKVCDWDWAGAEREYRRALALNPSYASAHHWYADFLSALGRTEEALQEITLAQQLDPLSLLINVELAWNSYMARDYVQAIAHARRTLEMEPNFAAAQLMLGLASAQCGRFDDALAALRIAYERSNGNPATVAALGYGLAAAGRRAETLALLEELRARAAGGYVSPYSMALLHAAVGNADAALACLHHAYAAHDFWLVWMAREPRLDCLRGDARFRALVARVGLPQ